MPEKKFLPSYELAVKLEKEFLRHHRPGLEERIIDFLLATVYSCGLFPFVWLFAKLRNIFSHSAKSDSLPYMTKRELVAMLFLSRLHTMRHDRQYSIQFGEVSEIELVNQSGFSPQILPQIYSVFFMDTDLFDSTDPVSPTKKQSGLLLALALEFRQWLESCDTEAKQFKDELVGAKCVSNFKVKDDKVILEIHKMTSGGPG